MHPKIYHKCVKFSSNKIDVGAKSTDILCIYNIYLVSVDCTRNQKMQYVLRLRIHLIFTTMQAHDSGQLSTDSLLPMNFASLALRPIFESLTDAELYF
jgi:hypothetical protein